MSAKLFLFGQFRWELGSGRVVPKLRDKTTALIAYLALSGNGVVRRQYAADLLWENGKDPLASVRQAVREIKEMELSLGSDLFQSDAQYLSLDLNRIWVDARLATQCASKFNISLAEQLINCDLGRLLQDCRVDAEFFNEWMMSERNRREENLEYSLDQLLSLIMARSAGPREVTRVAHAILSFDATNERAHRAQMKAYLEDGDRASALRQYEICQEVLQRELGVEPSEVTAELAEQIKYRKPLTHDHQVMLVSPQQYAGEVAIKPVIFVQDFVTNSDDPLLGFFAQTFRSDICEQLSRNERFSVRGHGPGNIENGKTVINSESNPQITHYRIRGNIISVSDSTTILVQMIDDATGDILWMKRLKPEMKALLSGSDEQAVLAAIEMYRMVELKETENAQKIEEGLLTARQCLLRAVPIMFRFSEDAVSEAKRYLHRALIQSPGYSEAMAWLAFLKSIEIGQGYASDPQAAREEAGELVRRSIELSPGSDIGLAIAGHLEAFLYHDFETALEYFDRSHSANPNCAYAWGFSSITHCYIGKPDKALELLGRCRLIMPFDAHPYYFDTARCIASMLSGRYEDAVRIGRQVLRNNPNFHANYRPLISSLGHLGRLEEAEPVRKEFEKFQPDFSINWHLSNYPPLEEEITQKYVQGLRRAGVAEG